MQTRNFRQRETLYAGIAAMPQPGIDQVTQRFETGFQHRPHIATLCLMRDLHRLAPSTRQALPGVQSRS